MAVPLGEKARVGDLLSAVGHTFCVRVYDFLCVYNCTHGVVVSYLSGLDRAKNKNCNCNNTQIKYYRFFLAVGKDA